MIILCHKMRLLILVIALLSAVVAQYSHNNVCSSLADYAIIDISPNCYYDPDVGASPGEIVNRHGYPFESFEITTEDGYDVRLMRIPREGAPPVLLVNGMFMNSLAWLDIGNQSLAFILYDAGYDVWLANYRGSLYSTNNIEDQRPNSEFWNFSFYELGYYDVPAFMEFMGNTSTSREKIIYIGHSMGTTMSFVYAITKRDHASVHLRAIISLAPVSFMGGFGLLINILGWLTDLLTVIVNSFGIHNIGYYNNAQKAWFDVSCFSGPTKIFCVYLYQLMVKVFKNVVPPESLPLLASQLPSGTSVKTLAHYGQLIRNNRFQNYDYGAAKNVLRYGSDTPPQFDISQINIPVYLYYGKNDQMTTEKSILRFYNALTTTKNLTQVSVDGLQPFTHAEFVLSRSKAEFLYKPLLNQLSSL